MIVPWKECNLFFFRAPSFLPIQIVQMVCGEPSHMWRTKYFKAHLPVNYVSAPKKGGCGSRVVQKKSNVSDRLGYLLVWFHLSSDEIHSNLSQIGALLQVPHDDFTNFIVWGRRLDLGLNKAKLRTA